MSPTRRSFIRSAAVSSVAAAMSPVLLGAQSGSAVPGPGNRIDTHSRSTAPKKCLVLGGTGFIGPPMVEQLLAAGHEVTIFNRGRTNADLFPGVEKIQGDRNDDIEGLRGRTWDICFDNNATLPRWVKQTAELLAGSVHRYVHVSSISVYAESTFEGVAGHPVEPGSEEEHRLRLGEDAPLAQLPDDYDGSERVTGTTYGPFKWMAEDEAKKAFPGRATIVRPGLIVGPGDPSDRFTYWPVRIALGGEVLVPGSGLDPIQIIDTRDLAAFIIHLAVNDVSGTYNGVGPISRMSMAEMVHGIRATTGGAVRFTWADTDFLAGHGVNPWQQMPVWIPGDRQTYTNIDRSIEAGLVCRPLADTARDTLEWHRTRPPEQQERLRFGLTAEKEAEVLAAWHAR